ncbi:hypothetical protein [Sphingopyxis sp. GW247-27LB]|uniref:hypothetical protein n=1 Tax=Sphingopyxis sp. GW247-27LB TaxID=2012632 RepID=UPI000BA79646|nr:hypothetical protein [Sphingopyxis sp. GW247-27LB]PAL23553.1 hypothetical protein CD928_05660 [Sphingopyxis sp. GW247-27LB]
MTGYVRHSDEDIAAVYNDTATYPRMADVRDALGYRNARHLSKRLSALRALRPELFTVDRSTYRPTKMPEPGRYLVRVNPRVDRWLLTAAQDETAIHEPFWRNLHRYAEHLGAEVMVGGFTYNKALFEDHAARTGVFNSAVQPYLVHDDVNLGPLLFAAKMNILPTAVRPLSGLDGYSRGRWAVYPHAKVQLVSVPSLPGTHPAMIMTTGCCTVPNYIEKKAGLKAEFHHQIGATIVEVDEDGRIFCRQIGAATDGSFQDLDIVVRGGEIVTGQRIEQATWGDIHIPKIDPVVARTIWGYDVETGEIATDGMFHALRPRHQAFHDLLDFSARNHHRRGDPHFNVAMTAAGKDRVEDEVRAVARFLRATAADWSTSVVVASNHNDALVRWLREADPRLDATNGRYWCELNAEYMRRLEHGDHDFDIIEWAIKRAAADPLDDIVFVPRNGSYLVCQAAGGIETALHGDEGPNGARGSALNMNRMAMRINRGHDHTASIVDGVYTSGLVGLMDQGYNSGPSSWSHTQTLTYPSAKRTLVTIIDGKYRA